MQSGVRKVEWDQHVNSWIFQNPRLGNLCIIRYEDMLNDAFVEVEKIVRFAGLDVRRQKFMAPSRSQVLINFENWKSEADSGTSTIKTRKSVSSVKVRREAGRRVLVEQKRPMSKKNWARP
jgi:hypothetical protein